MIVAIKLAIVLLVIVVGIFYVKAANYTPVHPAGPADRDGQRAGPRR